MFAGTGDFFRPVDLRKEVSPAAAIKPPARAGDDAREHYGAFSAAPDAAETALPIAASAADAGDAIELSLAALLVMLTGRKADIPPADMPAPDAADDRAQAAHAYSRAQAMAPAAVASSVQTSIAQVAASAGRVSETAAPPAVLGVFPPAQNRAQHSSAQGMIRMDDMAASRAGAEIFYMLAALEKSGVQVVTVMDGQRVYDVLRAKCRALDIHPEPPSPPPHGF